MDKDQQYPSSGPSLRLLAWVCRVTWPFMLTVATTVALGLFSMSLMSAGRAYVSGESLWSKGQKNAVLFLADYSRSCAASDFRQYQAALSVPLGDRKAREALSKPQPDLLAAREGFIQGQNHPSDIDDMIMLFTRFGEVSFMREAIRIWAQADTLVEALESEALALQQVVSARCQDEAAKQAIMTRILEINDRLTPLQREFSDTVGQANRIVQALTNVLLLLSALTLSSLGLLFTWRVVGNYVQAQRALQNSERALRQQIASREVAIEELRLALELGLGNVLGRAETQDWHAGGQDALAKVSALVSEMVARLHRDGEQLNAIFALSPDGFVSFGADRRVNHVNPAFTKMTGITADLALGMGESAFSARLQALAASGSEWPEWGPMLERRGEERPLQQHPRVVMERPVHRVIELRLREGHNPAIAQVLYLRDVTHETEVDRIKNEFLSTAAHELRTPMASIVGFSELLMMREYPEAKKTDMLRTVHRQAERMASIVDELLDLARIEARRGKDFVIERLDWSALVNEVVHDFSVPPGRSAPRLETPAEAQWVHADRMKIQQAVGNVLSNAYKYSPDGGEVTLRWVTGTPAGDPPRPQVGLQVIDRGLGLKPEQLARMGERFYRADTSGRIPGTGLGVSIVQEILQLHEGRLDFDSRFGKGTTVTLWLPRAG